VGSPGFKEKIVNFAHNLNLINNYKKDKKYKILKTSPFGNTFTFDFSKAVILNEKLGVDNYTDFIAINFSSNGLIGQVYGQQSSELKDAYIRFDQELSQFLEFIDNQAGLENTIIYLTADRGAAYDPQYLSEKKVPSGYFNYNQSLALLKSYLNVVYGKGNWIQYYYKGQIFLNRSLIEDSNIKLEDFQLKIADFMVQFSGVANAITSTSLQSTNFSSGIFNKIQNSYNQNRSGDVLINLEPGWIEKGDDLTSSNSSYTYDTHVPLIFYGWRIKRTSISKAVDMVDIAATLSNLLEISYTNACLGNPIIDIVE
jgi:arylsulfatase A-like enzyme